MGLAYIVLGFVGALAYKNPFHNVRKSTRRILHGVTQITFFFSALMGLTIILINKIYIKKELNVHTLHDWFGIVTLCFTLLQAIVGVLKVSLSEPPTFLKLHGYTGPIVLLLGIISSCLGISEFFTGNAGPFAIALYVLLALLFLVFFFAWSLLPPSPEASGMEQPLNRG